MSDRHRRRRRRSDACSKCGMIFGDEYAGDPADHECDTDFVNRSEIATDSAMRSERDWHGYRSFGSRLEDGFAMLEDDELYQEDE